MITLINCQNPGFSLRDGRWLNLLAEKKVIISRIWSVISQSKALCKAQMKFVWGEVPDSAKQSCLGLTNSRQPHFLARTLLLLETPGLQLRHNHI